MPLAMDWQERARGGFRNPFVVRRRADSMARWCLRIGVRCAPVVIIAYFIASDYYF